MVWIEIREWYEGHMIRAEAEAETEEEARKKAEAKIEQAKREIDEIQSKCEHEYELIEYNDWFRSYKYQCKKCGKIEYKSKSLFSEDFFEAWKKGLTTIPRHP